VICVFNGEGACNLQRRINRKVCSKKTRVYGIKLLLLFLFCCMILLLCTVFTIIYLKHTVALRYVVLQLFCSYNLCYTQCCFPVSMFCTFTLVRTFRYTCAVPNMAVFCSFVISCLPRYVAQVFSE
jgi:hypothetical protein